MQKPEKALYLWRAVENCELYALEWARSSRRCKRRGSIWTRLPWMCVGLAVGAAGPDGGPGLKMKPGRFTKGWLLLSMVSCW